MQRKSLIIIVVVLVASIITIITIIPIVSLSTLSVAPGTPDCTSSILGQKACGGTSSNAVYECKYDSVFNQYVWGYSYFCPSGQTCSGYGSSFQECNGGEDTCTPGTWKNTPFCTADTSVVMDYHCTGSMWVAIVREQCATGETCQNGQCVADITGCTNPTGAVGSWQNNPYCLGTARWDMKCMVNGVWAPFPRSCATGETCQNGQCMAEQPTCVEDSWQGNKECHDNIVWDYQCRNGEWWWTKYDICGTNEICQSGQCIKTEPGPQCVPTTGQGTIDLQFIGIMISIITISMLAFVVII